MNSLTTHSKIKREGPVVLIIADGVGLGKGNEGDAFSAARTPTFDSLEINFICTSIKAHGFAVGLPSDGDMGNSEVGHNALGAGRIFSQGAKLVADSISSGKMFESETWKELIEKPASGNSSLHFIGLLSDGNVHSHIDHLFKMIGESADSGVKKIRIHTLLDGRDVSETSAHLYVEKLESFLDQYRKKGFDYCIASGGGRMITTMDRYGADWDIVKRGWEAHVLGKGRPFNSASKAIETFRNEDPSITDQYLPSFTIINENGPVGKIEDGDSVILFNFRGDRAIEISRAFDDKDFNEFYREKHPDVLFAGIMEYDGDLRIPQKYIVMPPEINNTISEYLVKTGKRQYAISETQKFGHVTYFWNGNKSGKFDENLEKYEEIPSDRVQFNERPWMKAAEITDKTIEAIVSGEYDFIRLNFANGDMVGHTGDFEAAVIAAEAVDLCIKRIIRAVYKVKGLAVITADHGNLDEMFETDKKTGTILIDEKTRRPKKKTSHTLNPVPVIIYDPEFKNEYELNDDVDDPGLGNMASTILLLMGLNPPEEYLPGIIKLKD